MVKDGKCKLLKLPEEGELNWTELKEVHDRWRSEADGEGKQASACLSQHQPSWNRSAQAGPDAAARNTQARSPVAAKRTQPAGQLAEEVDKRKKSCGNSQTLEGQ